MLTSDVRVLVHGHHDHLLALLVLVMLVCCIVLVAVVALHGGQNLGLLALGHAPETNGIARHAHGDALLQPTVLAPVPIDAHDGTLLVLAAGPVLDLLLYGAPEEALAALAGVDAVVEAAGPVAAHLAQDGGPVELDALLLLVLALGLIVMGCSLTGLLLLLLLVANCLRCHFACSLVACRFALVRVT